MHRSNMFADSWYVWIFWFFLISCTYGKETDVWGKSAPRTKRLGLTTSKDKRRIASPPQSVIEATFTYRKLYHEWPSSIEFACNDDVSRQAYKDFYASGITSLNRSFFSKDSMLVDFTYSQQKRNRNKGYYDQFVFGDFSGKFLFALYDDSIKWFKIIVK